MGFNLYFAGATCNKLIDNVRDELRGSCGLLFTFADGVKSVTTRMDYLETKFFIDSGAYSIARSGREVSLEEYISFINSTTKPEVFASLDAIPFPELNSKTAIECSKQSWNNYLETVHNVREENKHKILPVYHFGEPLDYLETILNTEIDGKLIPYMGLGGGNAGEFKRNVMYYSKVFDIISKSKNPNIKVHAFGMTVPTLLEMFPFYSADSTTWLMTAVNGSIILDNRVMVNISSRSKHKPGNLWNMSKDAQEPIIKMIEEKGFNAEELAEDYLLRELFNFKFFMNWANNYKFKGLQKKRKRLI